MATKKIRIDSIRTDGGTQIRAAISDDTVAEYADTLNGKTALPPILVFNDGEKLWLADGFHRLAAHVKAGRTDIMAEIRKGTLRDALLYAVGANSAHGLRRTNADKRRAVEVLLKDEEWTKWSDRQIAKQTGVGHATVSRIRNEMDAICLKETDSEAQPDQPRIVERNGTTYTMDTSLVKLRADTSVFLAASLAFRARTV